MYIIEFTDYSPNDETISIDDYLFCNINNAISYLKEKGFILEHDDIYKKGELFGTKAEIKTLDVYEEQ